MRIALLVHHPLDSGGDVARALALGRELGRRGHLVSLLCEFPRRIYRSASRIEVVRGPRFQPGLLRDRGLHPISVFWRWRWLSRRSIEVVHTFGVRPTVVMPAALAQRAGVRWVADWSDYWGPAGIAAERGPVDRWTMGALDGWLERSSRLWADGLTVVSGFLAELAQDWGAARSNVLRIGGGADVVGIRPLDKREARRDLGLEPDRPVVVYSGRSRFDLQLVGKIHGELRDRRPAVQLFLLGGAGAADLGLESTDGIIELGFLAQESMAQAIACADVTLLPLPDAPFNRARFPNRLGDYLAAARPVVTNPTGDAGRLVHDEGVGVAVSEDPAAMAAAVVTLLDDPERAREMGARGRRVAEEKMSWDRLAVQVEGFYDRL